MERERGRLLYIKSILTATAGVVSYEIDRRLQRDEAIEAFSHAEEKIKEGGLDLPENTHDKLVGLLVELRTGLHD